MLQRISIVNGNVTYLSIVPGQINTKSKVKATAATKDVIFAVRNFLRKIIFIQSLTKDGAYRVKLTPSRKGNCGNLQMQH
jgi:hypothetical protein